MSENVSNANLVDLCKGIKDKTIIERINSFGRLCKIKGFDKASIRGLDVKTVSGKCNPEFEEPEYFITSREIENEDYGKGVLLKGNFADLFFDFTMYYEKKGNRHGLLNPPFAIKLEKAAGKYEYIFSIVPITSNQVEINVSKNYYRKGNIIPDSCTFYYNTTNFDEILRIAYTFVYNPIFAFGEYKEIYMDKLKRKIVLDNEDLSNTIFTDNASNKLVKDNK